MRSEERVRERSEEKGTWVGWSFSSLLSRIRD